MMNVFSLPHLYASEPEPSEFQTLRDYLEEKCRPWRYVISKAFSILMWESPHNGYTLASLVTVVFCLISMISTLITTLAIATMFFIAFDYLVPIVTENYLSNSMPWTDELEAKYLEALDLLATTCFNLRKAVEMFINLRRERPGYVFTLMMIILSIIAWFGSVINNYFLVYIFFMAAAFFPGLKKHGYVDQWTHSLAIQILSLLPKPKTN